MSNNKDKTFLNASSENELRNKISMILFTLEKEIGDHISDRVDRLKNIVPETYFKELLALAYNENLGSDIGDAYKKLLSACENYEIYEIRNAISHPNRGVNDNYWFKVAAIATDPVIEQLGFLEVKKSLIAALEGKITAPPTHWFLNKKNCLPNTLPKHTEHDITGFVGRRGDLKELKALIENKRNPAISIVGPGGTGKTALALAALDLIAHDKSSNSLFEGILYISVKRDQLTADGVKRLAVDATIQSIISELKAMATSIGFDNYFEPRESEQSSGHLLVCIDNFETILVEDECSMQKLNSILPAEVKILITSRIPVDGVVTYTLGNLKENDAVNLAHKYLERTGGKILTGHSIQILVKNLDHSPLAVKLALDLFNRGHNIATATGKAFHDVVSFSFTNLIERLSVIEIKILEILFLNSKSINKGEILSILDEKPEQVRAALVGLARTSLIIRSNIEGNDYYTLNETIKTLVQRDQRHLKIRSQVASKIKERSNQIRYHETIQNERKIGPESEDYVNPANPVPLKQLMIEAVRIIRGNRLQFVSDWLHRAEQIALEYDRQADFHYFYGRILSIAGDWSAAEQALRKAEELAPQNFWIKLSIVDTLLNAIDPDQILSAINLIEKIDPNEVASKSIIAERRLWVTTYNAYCSAERWEKVLSVANERLSLSYDSHSDLHCDNGALACCKLVRNMHFQNRTAALSGLMDAAGLYLKYISLENRIDLEMKNFLFFIKEVVHFVEDNRESAMAQCHELLVKISYILSDAMSKQLFADEQFDQCIKYIEILGNIEPISENPFRQIESFAFIWRDISILSKDYDKVHKNGFLIGHIEHIVANRAFILAKVASIDATVLCHRNALAPSKRDFDRIRNGGQIVIRLNDDESDRLSAKEWWRSSQFLLAFNL